LGGGDGSPREERSHRFSRDSGRRAHFARWYPGRPAYRPARWAGRSWPPARPGGALS